jgi:uncharacterized protein (DUF2236 family)
MGLTFRSSTVIAPLRRVVIAGLVGAIGEDADALRIYDTPAGDPGLFGPDSLVWDVHADLGAMLIGGFAALMLQSLHPLAMAGVADHSQYHEDPLGRLRRTARFVAGTTFGPSALAEDLIAKVRGVHDRVEGTAPDGRHYSANDPALLTFVHVSEVTSFLHAYQRYGPRPLLRAEKDRYVADVAVVAERLGARDVPRTVGDARAYLLDHRHDLALGSDAEDAIAFLRQPIGTRPSEVIAHRIVTDAATGLLPAYARALLPRGLRASAPSAATVGGALFATTLRLAIGPSVIRARAARRVHGGNDEVVDDRADHQHH